MKKIMTRQEAIDEMVEWNIQAEGDIDIERIIRDGFKGYANYTNQELHDDILPGIDEDELEILD